jgi:hypothetical protein
LSAPIVANSSTVKAIAHIVRTSKCLNDRKLKGPSYGEVVTPPKRPVRTE